MIRSGHERKRRRKGLFENEYSGNGFIAYLKMISESIYQQYDDSLLNLKGKYDIKFKTGGVEVRDRCA